MSQDASPSDPRPRLGRGLAALLGDAAEPAPEQKGPPRKAPIEFLRPNPRNPRKHFDETDLQELADSIRERGVLQPVIVRAIPKLADAYEIIAGERRWRAAQRAGLHEIPIVVIEAGDREALELAIIENVQRADLNALEEAEGYERLGADYSYSHGDIARIVGKSRPHVANTLRLMKLPPHARALLAEGKISAGHARALLALPDPDRVADRIVEQGLTVRDVERLADAKPEKTPRPTKAQPSADTRALEDSLARTLGAEVTIRHKDGRGTLKIAFRDFEQLDGFLARLRRAG